MEHLKNDDHMLPELEAIEHLNDAIMALEISPVLHPLKELDLNICIIDIEFLVFTNFGSNNFIAGIFTVDAAHDLAEGTLVYNLGYLIAIAQLFADLGIVVALFICNRILILPTNRANSIDLLINAQFELYLFEFCELLVKFFDGFLRSPAIKI